MSKTKYTKSDIFTICGMKIKVYEDDTPLVIPEKYKKMSLEEIEEEKERILKELLKYKELQKSPTTLLTNSSKCGI